MKKRILMLLTAALFVGMGCSKSDVNPEGEEKGAEKMDIAEYFCKFTCKKIAGCFKDAQKIAKEDEEKTKYEEALSIYAKLYSFEKITVEDQNVGGYNGGSRLFSGFMKKANGVSDEVSEYPSPSGKKFYNVEDNNEKDMILQLRENEDVDDKKYFDTIYRWKKSQLLAEDWVMKRFRIILESTRVDSSKEQEEIKKKMEKIAERLVKKIKSEVKKKNKS